MQIIGQVKTLTMSNSTGEYHLSCNLKADGCETPTPGKNYLLINKNTHWKLPGAEKYIDLAFIQSWTVTYTKTENVGLVPQDHAHAGFWLGLYMLDSVNTPKTQ